MDKLFTRFNIFKENKEVTNAASLSALNEAEYVTDKEIYDDYIQSGCTEDEALERLLDIKTHGLWAAADQDSIDRAKEKLKAKLAEPEDDEIS